MRLRLFRMGAKKRPFYRIVATDSRKARNGKYIEVVGTYNPITDPAEIKLNKERVDYWLQAGAETTETVKSLLKKQRLL